VTLHAPHDDDVTILGIDVGGATCSSTDSRASGA
jgi:hypothetical protein